MTIVDHFDPRNGEHLRAWQSAVEKALRHGFHVNHLSLYFGEQCGIEDDDYEWPDDWGQLIIAKMAAAWLEENMPPPYVEVQENVRRVKLVPR